MYIYKYIYTQYYFTYVHECLMRKFLLPVVEERKSNTPRQYYSCIIGFYQKGLFHLENQYYVKLYIHIYTVKIRVSRTRKFSAHTLSAIFTLPISFSLFFALPLAPHTKKNSDEYDLIKDSPST